MAAQSTSLPGGVVLRWRGRLSDAEMTDLVASYGGTPVPGWWDTIRPHSFGWVTARTADDVVVGFVNIVTDGGDHAFLIDTKTRGAFQRRGIATRVVAFAAEHARDAGCEWLHVDFEDHLRDFYFEIGDSRSRGAVDRSLRPLLTHQRPVVGHVPGRRRGAWKEEQPNGGRADFLRRDVKGTSIDANQRAGAERRTFKQCATCEHALVLLIPCLRRISNRPKAGTRESA